MTPREFGWYHDHVLLAPPEYPEDDEAEESKDDDYEGDEDNE